MRFVWLWAVAITGLVVEPVSVLGQSSDIRSLANSLAQDIASAGRRSIAVVDFTDLQGNPTELGRFLAEEFAVALTRTRKGFEVVDRNHLNTLLREHKLASSGLIDPATAKKLGQIAGVDAIVSGSLTPFGDSVRIAVKVLATDTARIVTADSADLPKTRTIEELLGVTGKHSGEAQLAGPDAAPRTRVRRDSTGGSQPIVAPAAAREFVFELLQCRGIGSTVRCTLRITNRGPDRELQMVEAKAYDNAGNEVETYDLSLANKQRESLLLVSGVPVAGTIVLDGFSASASAISLLRIACWWRGAEGGDNFVLQFRNAPLAR